MNCTTRSSLSRLRTTRHKCRWMKSIGDQYKWKPSLSGCPWIVHLRSWSPFFSSILGGFGCRRYFNATFATETGFPKVILTVFEIDITHPFSFFIGVIGEYVFCILKRTLSETVKLFLPTFHVRNGAFLILKDLDSGWKNIVERTFK